MNHSIQFQTIVDKIGVTIDQSVLYFRIFFSGVPITTVREAAIEYCRFINDFFNGEFISRWIWDGSKKKKMFSPTTEKLSEIILSDPYSPSLIIDRMIKRSETMYLGKHINELDRRRMFDLSIPCQSYSTDYESYVLENIFPILKNDAALKDAIIGLFSKEGKRPIAPNLMHDAEGFFYSAPEDMGSPICLGQAAFQISICCLGNDLNKAAELFANEIKNLCTMLNLAGGSVGIAPEETAFTGSYMKYFRNANNCDLDHDLPDGSRFLYDWNRVAFVSDCAWVNVLSPIARKKLFPKNMPSVPESGLIVKELPNYSIYVQLDKEPEEVDVNDLIRLKKFLYPALYPGKKIYDYWESDGKLRLDCFPRNWWERVPVFPEEITVQNGVITFEYKKGLFGISSQ